MDYIYAGTRAKVLKQKLLSETQTERLFGAKSVAETFKVLQDTFLAPYLAKHEKTDITEALDECIVDTKKLLKSIAPQPEILDVLWVKYDYHNLKTIIKGKRMGLGNEDITNLCFSAGIYAPEQILREYEKGDLRALNYHFHEAMEEAEHSERRYGIDVAMNTHYFKTIKTIADKTKDTFLRMFVACSLIHLISRPPCAQSLLKNSLEWKHSSTTARFQKTTSRQQTMFSKISARSAALPCGHASSITIKQPGIMA